MAIDRDGDGPPLRRPQDKADNAETLRATPFTEDVFDDDYYRGRGRSGGSPFGLIVGVVVGALVAGVAAWFVFKDQGLGSLPTSENGVPVVRAETTPYKIKPDSPGGMQVENQDKTVYDRVAKTDAPARVENLLPPPEQPKAPPKVEAAAKTEPPKPETKEAKAPEPAADAKSPLDEKRDELAAMIANLDEKQAATAKSTAEAKAAFGDGAKPAAARPEEVKPAPSPQPAEPMPKLEFPPERAPGGDPMPAAGVTPAPPAQLAAVPASGAGLQIQLAAAKSEEAAMAEWNRLKAKHAAALGALTPAVVRADLGERGVFFRLRAGMLPDKPAAEALCATLAAQGDACLVVKSQ